MFIVVAIVATVSLFGVWLRLLPHGRDNLVATIAYLCFVFLFVVEGYLLWFASLSQRYSNVSASVRVIAISNLTLAAVVLFVVGIVSVIGHQLFVLLRPIPSRQARIAKAGPARHSAVVSAAVELKTHPHS